jgi:hypothetical protein
MQACTSTRLPSAAGTASAPAAGGTIYDLAAPMYGYTPRGEDFVRLRTELRRVFGLEAA